MSAHTPGPWRWEVDLKHHRVQLCGGRPQFDKTVMSFVRWGMSNAAPEFVHDDGDYPKLTRCDTLTAIVLGREHHKDWFQTIDNADARLIAAAPDLLEALQFVDAWISNPLSSYSYAVLEGLFVSSRDRIQTAIAKATGTKE